MSARLPGVSSAPPMPCSAAGGDELPGGLREPADQRGAGEPADADDEDLAAAVPVAQRAAEQDQRGQRQRVAGDGPLQPGQRRAAGRAPIEGSATWTAVESRNAMPDASTVTSDQPAARPASPSATGCRSLGRRAITGAQPTTAWVRK